MNIAKQLGGLVDKVFAASSASTSATRRLESGGPLAWSVGGPFAATDCADAEKRARQVLGIIDPASLPKASSPFRRTSQANLALANNRRVLEAQSNVDFLTKAGIAARESEYGLTIVSRQARENAHRILAKNEPLQKEFDDLLAKRHAHYVAEQTDAVGRGEIGLSDMRTPEQLEQQWKLRLRAIDTLRQRHNSEFLSDYRGCKERFLSLAGKILLDLHDRGIELYSSFGLRPSDPGQILKVLAGLILKPQQLDLPAQTPSPDKALLTLGIEL